MSEPTHVTPRDICEELKIGMDPVLAWIHSKQLKASNVSNSSSRPRWRIAKKDLADFLEQRSNRLQEANRPSRKITKPGKKYV